NLYRYVGNDSTNATDPYGLELTDKEKEEARKEILKLTNEARAEEHEIRKLSGNEKIREKQLADLEAAIDKQRTPAAKAAATKKYEEYKKRKEEYDRRVKYNKEELPEKIKDKKKEITDKTKEVTDLERKPRKTKEEIDKLKGLKEELKGLQEELKT